MGAKRSLNKSRSRRLRVSNLFHLLGKAYVEGHDAEFLDILTSIYCFLCHKAPSGSLKNGWRKELRVARTMKIRSGLDFFIKGVGKYRKYGRAYWIRLFLFEDGGYDCALDYCNGALMTDCVGKDPIVKRNDHLWMRLDKSK